MSGFFEKLSTAVKTSDSLLCIGLDPQISRLPKSYLLKSNPVFAFNKTIVDATRHLVCAYKLNLAFYEAVGDMGMHALRNTLNYIPEDIPVLGDAKRSDIGHSAAHYARAVFDVLKFDAVTVVPYFGSDSLKSFQEYQDKGIFVLCLSSNPGAADFQLPGKLYLQVAQKVKELDSHGNFGLVVGATYPEQLKEIRQVAGEMTFLVPGIGAQEGKLKETLEAGLLSEGQGLIINVSRAIIFPEGEGDFAELVQSQAQAFQNLINQYRSR